MTNKYKAALVVLAAGLGSRYAGGIKQLEPMGPNGEIIMDYSVYDAIRAGFDKVVFIIRRDIYDAFYEMIGKRLEKQIKVEYVFQELDSLPDGYKCPTDRVKPWGHGHALVCCKNAVNEPFAVINADDFYGREAFEKQYEFLTSLSGEDNGSEISMSGFILKNTLSDYGSVNRGVCVVKDGILEDVVETYGIKRGADGIITADGADSIDGNRYVSMNMWGCGHEVIDLLEEQFKEFLDENIGSNKAEFLLPAGIDKLIKSGRARCRVLETHGKWFGVTYAEDKPFVQQEIRKLITEGEYPEKLWAE